MDSVLLAIDAGSTGVRALVVDREGTIRGRAYREVSSDHPKPGWVELDPVLLWAATREVVERALDEAKVRRREIGALGVANQRATALLWDRRTGEPLYRAIGWQDLRTAGRVEELLREGIYTNTLASATKVEWLLRHVPGADERARRGEVCFGTLDSWLAWNLSGRGAHVTDASNASCTGLYDYLSGGWDPNVLEALAIPQEILPEIRASSEIVAPCPSFDAPLAALAGDQQAAMFGLLRHRPGDLKVTFGTSAMCDIHTGSLPAFPSRGSYPLVLWQLGGDRSFCLEGTVLTAGAAVQWLRDALGLLASPEESSRLASSVPDTGGVWFVPAFQGLGTPHMDARARAVLGGLSRATTRAQIVRALLEGVAFRCREVLHSLVEAAGTRLPAVLRVDGGAAANDFLLQTVADLVGIAVERPKCLEGTALGASYLAGLAVGIWKSAEELRHVWNLGARFEPRSRPEEVQERVAAWTRRLDAVRAAEAS